MRRAALAIPALLAAIAACTDDDPAVPTEIWDPSTVVPASVLRAPDGYVHVRGTFHLHSVVSHDACYVEPWVGEDGFHEPCLTDLRAAICGNRHDFVFLADHFASLADRDLETLFLLRGQDRPVVRDGRTVASRILCDDGFESIWMTGVENGVSPAGLEAHVADDPATRHAEYRRTDPAHSRRLRDLGAYLFVPHPEGRDLDFFRSVDVDAMEIYNLHANIDPSIRAEDLGLPALEPLGALLQLIPGLAGEGPPPHPELAILAFLSESPAVRTWDTLLAEGKKLHGVLGLDAHQNSIPLPLADGDTADSYRRMLHWFSEHVLVPEDAPPDDLRIKDAVRAGRYHLVFDVMGVPDGFEFYAVESGTRVEQGGTVSLARGARLEVRAPGVWGLDPTWTRRRSGSGSSGPAREEPSSSPARRGGSVSRRTRRAPTGWRSAWSRSTSGAMPAPWPTG